VDEPADRRELEQTVAALGDSMLLFSTDYPHWDGDEPGKVFQSLSEESRRRIYSANATEFFPLARSA
jgi:predicted TIM-barrel fold metal-dependent hydrolase